MTSEEHHVKPLDEILKRILEVGRPLLEHGSSNWALSRNDALAAIQNLERESRLILGGDVWLESKGKFARNGDSWFFQPVGSQADSLQIAAAADKAATYVKNYREPRDASAFFELVVAR
jgi:hypothetical protein